MSEQRPLPPLSEQADSRGPRAFPISADEFFDRGMLLRDYFAAAALTGLLARGERDGMQMADSNGDADEAFAIFAYEFADEMLAARKGRTPEVP